MAPNPDNDRSRDFQAFDIRLTRVERYLWPPIEPGGKPPGPGDPPPFGPMEMRKSLKALEDKFDALDRRAATKDELAELREEIARLDLQISALQEVCRVLSSHMAAPM